MDNIMLFLTAPLWIPMWIGAIAISKQLENAQNDFNEQLGQWSDQYEETNG